MSNVRNSPFGIGREPISSTCLFKEQVRLTGEPRALSPCVFSPCGVQKTREPKLSNRFGLSGPFLFNARIRGLSESPEPVNSFFVAGIA
jgi:hypothetical protein